MSGFRPASYLYFTDLKTKKNSAGETLLQALYAGNMVSLLITELTDNCINTDFQKTFNDVCLQFGSPFIKIGPETLEMIPSGKPSSDKFLVYENHT